MQRMLLQTPAMLASFRSQRKWERKVLDRAAMPYRVQLVNKLADLPFGKMFFAVLCFTFFGVDIMCGAIGGFDIANQKLEEARKEHSALSKRMLDDSNKKFEQKLEVLDMTRRVKEMGTAAALEQGPRAVVKTLSYGGGGGKEIPNIPGM
jgi:hypothetical protein